MGNSFTTSAGTLATGTITDGQYLKRSGSSIVSDTPSGTSGQGLLASLIADAITKTGITSADLGYFFEDFDNHAITLNGWTSLTSSTPNTTANLEGGVINIGSTGSGNSTQYWRPASVVDGTRYGYAAMRFELQTGVDAGTQTAAVAMFSSDQAEVMDVGYISAGSTTHFSGRLVGGGGTSTAASTVAVDTTTHVAKIWLDDTASGYFSIDGESAVTLNVTTAGFTKTLRPWFGVHSAGAAFSANIDWVFYAWPRKASL